MTRAEAGPARPLGTSGDSPTPPLPDEVRQGRREDRHDRLKPAQRALSSSKSSRQCFFPAAANVAVSVGRQLTAHVSAVHRCGSSWSCPVCAPVVRETRAREIEAGVSGHLAGGGGALLLTLTSRHQRRDALAPRLALLAGALNVLLKGAGWDRRRRRLGWMGAIKALEITYGANGWHPHAHVLLILARPLLEDEVADLEAWLFARWAGVVQAAGFGTVTREHGVDLRPVTTAADLGGYLTKVEGKGGRTWGVGQELARSDLKRGGDSLVPFDLLADFVATGDVEAANLWREYEAATFGKQSVRWSPGLKDALGVRDVSDVEAAAAEGAEGLTYFRWLVEAALWRATIKGRRIGVFLTACEREAADRFATADRLGIDLVPLADHEATDHLGDP